MVQLVSARNRHRRWFAVLLTIACAACQQPWEPAVGLSAQGRRAQTPMLVEFDLPDEFWTKDKDGRDVVTRVTDLASLGRHVRIAAAPPSR